uniref:RNA-directed DNA polymerase n=1 Tax=Oryctolagus cuniculus TaxID=9986 RepID=A0A5F9DRR6_RABIT
MTTEEMHPLFRLLEGDACLNSPRQLTKEAKAVLKNFEQRLKSTAMQWCDPTMPLSILVFIQSHYPYALLWQEGPFLFIYPHNHMPRSITSYAEAMGNLVLQAIHRVVEIAGRRPQSCILPLESVVIQEWAKETWQWSHITITLDISVDNHYPNHPFIRFCDTVPLHYFKRVYSNPIPKAPIAFTDGAKGGTGVAILQGQVHHAVTASPSPQHAELAVVAKLLNMVEGPLNIVSDSLYVVNAVKRLGSPSLISKSSTVFPYFELVQHALFRRSDPIFITHIRAHTSLPGPLTAGNALADQHSRFLLACTAMEQATEYHKLWHVNSKTLSMRFNIPIRKAKSIVQNCEKCVIHQPVTMPTGANPRGLYPCHIWQMDVTHIPAFGKLSCVHVTVDTYSGVVMATAAAKESTSHVMQHMLQCFASWGIPNIIKTDNGPAYTSKVFAEFLATFHISHLTGIPYNPTGQAVVERTNLYLKNFVLKQKGGIGALSRSPKDILNLTLLTINFLNKKADGLTPAERHVILEQTPNSNKPYEPTEAQPHVRKMIMWKDPQDNKWKGPYPLIRRVRGAVCFLPQEEKNPIWTPERRTRTIEWQDDRDPTPTNNDATVTDDGQAG